MTTGVLTLITAVAVTVLVGVLGSIVRALHAESALRALRRSGVPVRGTVVDNVATSTAHRHLLFAPVVEFRTRSGRVVTATAQQSAATSWHAGTTVDVRYDQDQPDRFVLAGAPAHSAPLANALVGFLVAVVLVGTILAMHQIWQVYRYDKPEPVESTDPAGALGHW